MNPPDRIQIGVGRDAYVRDLNVRYWAVYRDLAFYGLPDTDVLQKYDGLELEDLAAVRDYALYLIRSRTHDEITGRKVLPKEALRHGAYYKGRCRNATVCRWNADENHFFHWREKLGYIYIETICYPTDELEPWWDVFNAASELPNPPFEIPFDGDAEFHGNPNDLSMYNEEMWAKTQKAAIRPPAPPTE